MKEIEILQKEFALTNVQLDQLEQYYQLLVETNQQMNLTAITEKSEVYIKHFFDSLSLSQIIKIDNGISLIDVGTGAGFPGLPFKIAFPDVEVVLLDSLQKRLRFLQEVIHSCNLGGIRTVHARAEDGARRPELRQQFDVVTARAVARLNVLAEYLLPYVRVGGVCVAMKGPGAEEELAEARIAIERLGGEIVEIKKLVLPCDMGERNLIVLEKKKGTPKRYPRKAGIPSKEPIS